MADLLPSGGSGNASALIAEHNDSKQAHTYIQQQIDALTGSSDVTDIVGTYTDLIDYDTTHLKDNDIIKVISDNTHSDASSYYRWIKSGDTGSWSYIGSEGPYYTKSEANEQFIAQSNIQTSFGETLSDEKVPSEKLTKDTIDNLANQFQVVNALPATPDATTYYFVLEQ